MSPIPTKPVSRTLKGNTVITSKPCLNYLDSFISIIDISSHRRHGFIVINLHFRRMFPLYILLYCLYWYILHICYNFLALISMSYTSLRLLSLKKTALDQAYLIYLDFHYTMLHWIACPDPNFNCGTVWEWMSNCISHFTVHVITYPRGITVKPC